MASTKFSAKWTTAHQLKEDCYQDVIPKDPEVRKHYGFEDVAASPVNRDFYSNCNFDHYTDEQRLLGLFQGLLKTGYLGVDPRFLDHWRLEGTLVENIIRAFEKGLLPNKRGGYYPWFVSNKARFQEIWSEEEGANGSSLRSTEGDSVRVNQTEGTCNSAKDGNAAARTDNASKTSPPKDIRETGGGKSDFGLTFKRNLRRAFE